MASRAEIEARIDSVLDTIFAEASFLPGLVESWAGMAEKDRVVWDIEWYESMRRLEALSSYCRDGEMSAEQASRYGSLLRKLKESEPVLRVLDLEIAATVLESPEAA